MEKELLKIRDIMKIFGISRRTVYYWIEEGLLKPVKVRGMHRFRPEDIDPLIQSKGTQSRRKKIILSIDDDLLVRESIKNILDRYGYIVTVAANGQEALDMISKRSFDLILTDLRMPGMNGIDVLRAIRERLTSQNRPLPPEIILTAYDDPPFKEAAKELGVREFVMKPFDLNDFISILRRNLV